MNKNEGSFSCTVGCWLVALLAGILAAVLLMVLGGWTFMQGVFIGALIFVVAGLLLSWIMCRPMPQAGEAKPGVSASSVAAGAAAATAATGAAAASGNDTTSDAGTSTSGGGAAAASGAAGSGASASTATAAVKPSTQLPGQQELAERKGEWKYEAPAAKEKPAKAKKAAPKKAAGKAATKAAEPKKGAPKKAAAKADVAAHSGSGTKPETLAAAREGGPDNLKEIKGVGPKLEKLLHSMGFFHFDQVASWGDQEVAWVDQNLEGFKGRVTRDEWVAQAKILAAGGETEFSKKVDKGGVY